MPKIFFKLLELLTAYDS